MVPPVFFCTAIGLRDYGIAMTPDTATATALRKRNRAFTRAFRGRNPSISIGVAIKRGESWQGGLGLGARSRRLWIPENGRQAIFRSCGQRGIDLFVQERQAAMTA